MKYEKWRIIGFKFHLVHSAAYTSFSEVLWHHQPSNSYTHRQKHLTSHTKHNLISYHFLCSSFSFPTIFPLHSTVCKTIFFRILSFHRNAKACLFASIVLLCVCVYCCLYRKANAKHTSASLIVIFPLDYRNQDEINNENTFEMRKKGPNGSV